MRFCAFLLTGLAFPTLMIAEAIVVRAPAGDSFIVQVNPQESFQSVVDTIDSYLAMTPKERAILSKQTPASDKGQAQKDVRIDYKPSDLNTKPFGKPVEVVRDYQRHPTKTETDTIAFVVKTLGDKSIVTIIKESSNLRKTQDKLNTLHPLRFVEVIFTSEELKASVANLRGRAWWSDFRGGVVNTLAEESKKQNLKTEDILDFAQNVGIDPNLILPLLQKGKWDEFLITLVEKIPRSGNPERYDM